MNLKELTDRQIGTQFTTDECCFVIREYVKVQTGKEINPIIEKRYGKLNEMMEVKLMNKMFNKAIDYFRSNR